jgi:hypothetical protein
MAVDTTKKKQEEWTPLGAGSDHYASQKMSVEDQALLKSYGDAYNNATTDEERRAAHDAAEQLRANYGYKGGTDGSQYIVQPPKATTSTGSTGGFDYSPAPTYTDNYSARIDEMLNNILNLMNVSSYYQTIIKGVVILIAVLLDAKSKDK